MRQTLLLLIGFMAYYVAATDSNPENRQNMFGFGGFGFIFGQGNILPFTQECNSTEIFSLTTTVTLYSTLTVSCTKSTNVACNTSGRRRRGILLDGEFQEQFPLSPTTVQEVEATLAPTQGVRYVDPQTAEMSPESQSQEIESAIQSGYFNDRKVPIPFVGSHSERNVGSANDRAVITVTPTTTITQFYTVTNTWTPVCSQWSPITQCPAPVG